MNTLRKFAMASLTMLGLLLLAFAPLGTALAQQVKVTAADPSMAEQGTTNLDVTVSGSGFDSTAQVNFLVTGTTNPGGITVKKVVSQGSRTLIATIDVDDAAVADKFDIEVVLSNGRKGKGTTLFTVAKKTVAVDPCLGESAAFVFWNQATNSTPVKDLYLTNASATCQRYLLSVQAGNYNRYSSFRVVMTAGAEEGRVVTTDGLSDLLLIRFGIGTNMSVDPLSISVQRIFDPAQPGYIDNTYFDLAADGHRLVYVTSDEDGGSSFLTRLRHIEDVDACVPSSPGASACAYDAGSLLAEHIGLSYVLSNPRWSTDGSWIYLEDRRGVYANPYISRVAPDQPLQPGQEPEIVLSGNSLRLFELRSRDGDEVMAYAEKSGTGCPEVRVVRSASCQSGICADRINSESPRALVIRFATLQAIDGASMTILADGAKEDRRGRCSGTDQITRTIDSTTTGAQTTELTSGAGPASR